MKHDIHIYPDKDDTVRLNTVAQDSKHHYRFLFIGNDVTIALSKEHFEQLCEVTRVARGEESGRHATVA